MRYRYYVSQAVLQSRTAAIGQVTRVPAPDLEQRVIAGVRQHCGCDAQLPDREVVLAHVERIALTNRQITVALRSQHPINADELSASGGLDHRIEPAATMLKLPWVLEPYRAHKGISFRPSERPPMDAATRHALLMAIGKAHSWMDDLAAGRTASFDDIAIAEGKVERHVRYLAPLAFVSPRIVEAIANGSAPSHLTVTQLARGLPHGWAEQERKFGIG